MNLNYYEVLGVPKHASDEQIKNAYRKLAMQHHPDRNSNSKLSEEIFKKVQIAFEHLSDPIKRKEHDECLMGQRPFPQQPVYTSEAPAQEYTQTDAQAYTSTSPAKKSNRWLAVCLLILFLGALALFYLYTLPHKNSLDAAVPKFLSAADKGTLTAQIASRAVDLSDRRVEDAMREAYGRNFIQNATSKCWLGKADPQSGNRYCMQPFSAYMVYTRTDELLYLWAIDKKSDLQLRQNSTSYTPIVLGIVIYDSVAEKVIAQESYQSLTENFVRLTAFAEPDRIACNGAFAWQVPLQGQKNTLWGSNGKRIVDLFQQIPAKYLDYRNYALFFIPSEKECMYEARIQNLKDPNAALITATFDKGLWAYRIP